MTQVVDWSDPCAKFKALSDAYYTIISGGNAAEVSYMANGVSRTVKFSFSNIAALKREMLASEDQCAILNGAPRTARRFAIDSGSRRRGWWWRL